MFFLGCHTVDNYDCADVATTTARPYGKILKFKKKEREKKG